MQNHVSRALPACGLEHSRRWWRGPTERGVETAPSRARGGWSSLLQPCHLEINDIMRTVWHVGPKTHGAPRAPPPPATATAAAAAAAASAVRHYNYILVSESTQRTYNGITTDLQRRLQQHRGLLPGGAKSTRTARDWAYLAVVHSPDWNGAAGRGRAMAFEARLRYPTGKRPRPSRFSGPAGRLASLELLLLAPPPSPPTTTTTAVVGTATSRPEAQQPATVAGTSSGAVGVDDTDVGTDAGAAVGAEGMWVWVCPKYMGLAGTALRAAVAASSSSSSAAVQVP
ncbi:hypothetical protein PLESTB_001770900 [Pleodorina starrii]|uniref:GIY-YIG domain-containing protein n=1 Tax=Pleodorina starrii TaxID=330485 RepID=A0A9W6C081_9CHLO|nr:hypothetical protein PLESTM_000827400 [Pleodorina starrii]GLC61569.1 hypothetical protein PLESTB_001770900 [Pleodorina starrii]GLC76965.1 hypothetical protein PLESTF_001861400 [Pleodorina starrii]